MGVSGRLSFVCFIVLWSVATSSPILKETKGPWKSKVKADGSFLLTKRQDSDFECKCHCGPLHDGPGKKRSLKSSKHVAKKLVRDKGYAAKVKEAAEDLVRKARNHAAQDDTFNINVQEGIGCACRCGGGQKHCSLGEFQCNNGHCLPGYYHCDGDRDCDDSEDEAGCQTTTEHPMQEPCSATQFFCSSGYVPGDPCISKLWVCDGDDDCSEGEDEHNCAKVTTDYPEENSTPGEQCNANQFLCSSDYHPGNPCIPKYLVCNGYYDCFEGEDEHNCVKVTTHYPDQNSTPGEPCNANQFLCSSDYHPGNPYNPCIPKNWVCDGHKDCGEGEDEHNCTEVSTDYPDQNTTPASHYETQSATRSSPTHSLPPPHHHTRREIDSKTHFFCSSNLWEAPSSDSWIDYSWVCNGRIDCLDGEDEHNCTAIVRDQYLTSEEPCNANQFLCSSGNWRNSDHPCIPKSYVCDGAMDCEMREDEQNCGKPSTEYPEKKSVLESQYGTYTDYPDENSTPESQYGTHSATMSIPTPRHHATQETCNANQFLCSSGDQNPENAWYEDNPCISINWVCDKDIDCKQGEDEINCPETYTDYPDQNTTPESQYGSQSVTEQ